MGTFHCFFRIFIVVLFTLPITSPIFAVKTATWTQQNHKNLVSGTLKSVAISSKGEVILTHKLKKIVDETEELYIWCLAEDSLGNIYAGTGNKGKVYKVAPDGQFSLFYNSPEVSILSLAIDTQNNIYAGTAPSGLVYKIPAGGNTPKTILNADENYVWSLTFDKSGNLYAATGANGKLYKITPDEKVDIFFDSDETNLTSLLFHNDNIYAGSDGKGTIFRIDMNGAVSVIHQTGQKEVRTLVAGANGNIFAGTVTTQPPQPGQGKPRRPSGPPTPDGRPPEPKKSFIYRITPDNVVSRLWMAPDPLVLSMIIDEEHLIVGTGDSGKVYQVDMDGDFVSLAKCEAGQIIAIHKAKSGKLILATGNTGKIFELVDEYEATGTLLSVSHDTKSVSQWGKIHWEGSSPEGTAITLATRSGNTDKPDNTWSSWSEELSIPEGSQIASPPARFLQWRSTLSTSVATLVPILKKVRVASVHFNITPDISDLKINIGPPPKERQNNNKQNSLQNHKIRSATWKAIDRNGDKLLFNIHYKEINEKNWKLIKEELTSQNYTWDSTSMPNGRYELKVEATDKLSNIANEAISIEKISAPFDIDNTQPVLAEVKSNLTEDNTLQISCVVTDELSPINSASYKIDSAEHWQAMFSEDGILDSHREVLFLETKKLEGEEHTITIMVTDTSGNRSVARGRF